MLSVIDLQVSIQGKTILNGVNLHVPDGEVHALFGPNGSGKSVMMMTIMGYPGYEVQKGRIIVEGRDITRMSIDERVRLGIGISEQRPPVIKGVKLRDVARLILPDKGPDDHTGGIASAFDVERFLDRDINDGLSGGESKQTELFLMLLTHPKLLLLDEPDSGVDPEHLRQVGRLINTSLRHRTMAGDKQGASPRAAQKAGLISTHSAEILEYVQADKAHLMMEGRIKCSGDPSLMMGHIRKQGYDYCVSCLESEQCRIREKNIEFEGLRGGRVFSEKYDGLDHFRPEGFRFPLRTEGDKDVSGSPYHLTDQEKASLVSVGINPDNKPEAGRFLLYDRNALITPPCIEGIEILPIQIALARFPEVKRDFYFKAVDREEDQYTKAVADTRTGGYFIRVREGTRIDIPVEAALFMPHEMGAMGIHNIVVLEEGARLHLVTGCTAGRHLRSGLHVAVSEHFVGKNASFINTMIHHWGPEFIVRPRSATVVERDGVYTENYYSVQPPKSIEMNPDTYLKGRNASARYMTGLICLPGTHCNTGGTVYLKGKNSAAEMSARAVNHGGTVIQKGLLVGAAEGSRAHVDCSGLMLSDRGFIEAIPGLRAVHPDARMSHEAAIGKIDAGAVNYLRSKGLNETQAVSLIVRGFLNIDSEIPELTPELERAVQRISRMAGHG